MSKLLSEQDLQKNVAELPDEMTPQRDLWAGIERAIQTKQQDQPSIDSPKKAAFIPTAWAASLVAAVLVTWVSFSPQLLDKSVNVAPQDNSSLNLVTAMQENFKQTNNELFTN